MRRLRAPTAMVVGVALLGAYAVYRMLSVGPTTAFDLTKPP